MKIKNERGFTLVEIMIVVAIIGLLAAIAIPNLLRARVNANEGAMKTGMRTFSSANESYRAAQTPPVYAPTIATLTGATPAYLDTSWSTANKHGYDTLTGYATAAGATYSLDSQPSAGGGATTPYCVDHTGVIVGNHTGAGGAGCTGGTPISG